MFTSIEIYRLVNAERLELDWDTQAEEAFEIYSKLSHNRQKKFNSLVKQAISQCQAEFDSLPESYQTKEDVEDLDMIIDDIIEKIEIIFAEFLE